ncbi:MAG: DUF4290 domain-containing protein [Lewinella sp.]|nr:DUF4290 domain-containing protein [Lewinella sp.]
MIYNSAKEPLVMPEYGRHVQLLVDYCKTIEDQKYRQRFARRIVALMMQMQPQNRNMEDYEEKLWKHLFRIADFELEVDTPQGIARPTPEMAFHKPDAIPYPTLEAEYRHYGHNVQTMIKQAIAMEDGPKREGFTAAIAAYMKLAYKTWNKEHYVSDDVIKGDLEKLSSGKLSIHEDQALENLVTKDSSSNNNNNSGRRRSTTGGKRSGNYSNRGRGRSGGGRRNYKK